MAVEAGAAVAEVAMARPPEPAAACLLHLRLVLLLLLLLHHHCYQAPLLLQRLATLAMAWTPHLQLSEDANPASEVALHRCGKYLRLVAAHLFPAPAPASALAHGGPSSKPLQVALPGRRRDAALPPPQRPHVAVARSLVAAPAPVEPRRSPESPAAAPPALPPRSA